MRIVIEGQMTMRHARLPVASARSPQLSDAEVAERLALYNGDGSFERDLQSLWMRGSDVILRASEAFYHRGAGGIFSGMGARATRAW